MTGSASQGIEELVSHAGWLRRLARGLLGDPDAADDVAQETLIAGWQRPPARDRDVRPWLAEVARNRAADERRRARRRRAREDEVTRHEPENVPSAETLLVDLETHRLIAKVVEELDEPFRQAIVLRYVDGHSGAEIARALGVAAGTVRWRLKEGLERIRQRLDERYEGDRRRWMRVLLPLVPAPLTTARRARPRRWASIVAAGIVAVAGLGWWQFRAPSRNDEARSPDRGEGATSAKRATAPLPHFVRPPTPSIEPLAAPLPPPATLLDDLLRAIASGSYDDFLEHAGDGMKSGLRLSAFQDVAGEVGPRVAAGYRAEALGALRREGAVTYLYVLRFADGGDEHLALLTLGQDKVEGFLIQ